MRAFKSVDRLAHLLNIILCVILRLGPYSRSIRKIKGPFTPPLNFPLYSHIYFGIHETFVIQRFIKPFPIGKT